MRHDDPDEGDEAADGDGCGGRKRSGHDDHRPGPVDGDAEGGGLVVAHAEHVEQAAVGEQHACGHDGVGRQEGDLAPARDRESPEEPGVHRVDGVRVALLDEGLHRREQAGHGHTGEDQ